MSRIHYYGRIRDSYGNIKADISVSIYLAGTTNAATVYTVITGGDPISVAPQVKSDSDGLISFYLDESYDVDQLFDIKIDNITYSNISMTFGVGDMKKSIYDANNSGVVDETERINGGTWS
jgi:hypothetical protein